MILNILIGAYVTQIHQRGVVDVTHYLRNQHEAKLGSEAKSPTTTVGFLMPCHSTPWRSHIIHPAIEAWALTCEPPLDVPLDRRHTYLDEADQFYADPAGWLDVHMRGRQVVDSTSSQSTPYSTHQTATGVRHTWPEYLVFFEQLEPQLAGLIRDGRIEQLAQYRECWRGFNSQWHDDWRRRGDVVVWCAS